MDIRKIKKLIELLEESSLTEIEIVEGEESVRLSRAAPGAAPMQAGYPAHLPGHLCIIEAMKMFNQIEADTSGVVKARSWSRTASRWSSTSRCS
jgi:biotin carboxyl carrier protein